MGPHAFKSHKQEVLPHTVWNVFNYQDDTNTYTSGQIIVFHQPRFPWNKGISLPQLPFGVRSCEIANKFDQINMIILWYIMLHDISSTPETKFGPGHSLSATSKKTRARELLNLPSTFFRTFSTIAAQCRKMITVQSQCKSSKQLHLHHHFSCLGPKRLVKNPYKHFPGSQRPLKK